WSPVGERSGYRFTEQDRTAAAQVANDCRVLSAEPAFVEWRAVLGCHSLGLDNVFDAEWNSRQAPIAGRHFGLDDHPRMNRRVELPDLLKALFEATFASRAIRLYPIAERLQP